MSSGTITQRFRNSLTKSLLLLIAVTIFLSLFKLGDATLFDVDEAVFSEATKEMIESGDWITPTYNGLNRYDKPILFYWFMALSYKIFGINEFGARFPSALASIFLALSVFLFVKKFRDERFAFYSAISCVLSIYFVAYSHAAVTDMTLTLFIALSLFSFYLWAVSKDAAEKKSHVYLYAFYTFCALAFLTKGLIGIVFPVGIAMVYIDITEGWRGIRKIFTTKGILFFFVIGAPWYIAQTLINGREFIDAFFMKHHFRRYLSTVSGHGGPLYYFLPTLIIGLFPWVVFLISGIRNTLREKDRFFVFSLIWVVFIFVFFSLSTTKLPNYILPAIPAAGILIASGMAEKKDRLWRFSYLFLAILSSVLSVGLIFARKSFLKSGFSDVDWVFLLAGITLFIALLGLYSFFAKKQANGLLSVLMFAFLTVLVVKALPLTNQDLQGALHKYSLYAKYRLKKHEHLFILKINNPSILFYSDKKVINVKDKDELIARAKESTHAIAIAKDDDVTELRNSGFRLLDKSKKYAILEREDKRLNFQ